MSDAQPMSTAIMEHVERRLMEDPAVGNPVLWKEAQEIDPAALEGLSKRAFWAKYPLQIKRRLAHAAETDGEYVSPPATSPPTTAEPPATAPATVEAAVEATKARREAKAAEPAPPPPPPPTPAPKPEPGDPADAMRRRTIAFAAELAGIASEAADVEIRVTVDGRVFRSSFTTEAPDAPDGAE